MKRILLLCLAAVSMMISCKKTSYVAKFDKLPQERAAEQIKLVSTTLTDAPNGWIATLPTQAGGGYGFYMSFDKAENVIMLGDMTATSSATSASSYYRVKQDMGAELVFDTYNYISMLNDPNGTLGGTAKIGYSSDIEFTFDRISGDSIVFIGKKFRQPFKLVKATAAQKASYLAGEYKTSIDKFTTMMSGIKNPYIELGAGAQAVKIGVSVNATNNLTLGKRVELSGLATDGKVLSGTGKYAYKLNGADILNNGILINGIRLVRILVKDNTTLAFYDDKGTEYIIKSNPSPLTPLSSLFGFPTTFPYKRMTIPSTGLPAGVNSAFTAVYNDMISKFVATGRTVASTAFILTSNSIFTVEINYLSSAGAAFVASATYTYTRSGDVITLDNTPVPNVNWPTRAAEIKPLADYMLTGPFKIDWAASTTPGVPNLGGLYRTGNLSSFIYGNL